MRPLRVITLHLAIILVTAFLAGAAHAQVPVRISIKFILDANGNRPATGNINTDDEVNAETTAAIDILGKLYSELTVERIEFVDLPGVSQWYGTSAETTVGRDALRAAAQADPATYLWRTNAINIYINGGPSSAMSAYPPTNNIILMNQGCGNQPSCILHEIGHSLNLLHTHDILDCTDTVSDDPTWTRDDIALVNFGCLYLSCNAGQQAAVDLVYNNVMSYHTDEPQNRLSPCQMDRISTQADDDRNWLLAKLPLYVNNTNFSLIQNGSFAQPYASLTIPLNISGLANKVVVLQQGTYTMPAATINTNYEIVTRSGPSVISHPGVQSYTLPVDLENSPNPKVRSSVRSAQDEDRAMRNVAKDAEKNEKTAVKPIDKAALRSEATVKQKIHRDNAVKGLLNAEQYAEKDEKLAIQMELAQRYRDAGDCEKAIQFFTKVAEGTDQPNLRKAALLQINTCRKNKPTKRQ